VTAHPPPSAGQPVSIANLAREVAELEKLSILLRRRDELTAEIEARGVAWSPVAVRPSEIIDGVAAIRGVSAKEIIGQSRRAPMVEARQEVMWLLREQRKADGSYRFSSPRIGQILGGRDHTTVLWGIARHAERMAETRTSPEIQREFGVEPAGPQPVGRVS